MNTAEELQSSVYAEDLCIAQAKEILRRRVNDGRRLFDKPQEVKDFLCINSAGLKYEVFSVMYLDSQNRLIKFEEMFRGTLTQTSVYPREVVVQALYYGAAAVILTHNHPSGVPEPSRADEALTQTLKAALALVDVKILDHLIVGGGGACSMAEKGLM